MLIALYASHHQLPFWHSPEQPTEVFNPKRHGRRRLTLSDETPLVRNSFIWPVLMGLHAIDRPLMAHVSAFCNCGSRGKWHFPKRVWIQITTLPSWKSQLGIPVTVVDGKTVVKHIWGGDNGTYTPFQLLGKQPVEGENTVPFWEHFFEQKLQEARAEALERFNQAKRKALHAGASAAELIALVA
jgi:hypothetical protein